MIRVMNSQLCALATRLIKEQMTPSAASILILLSSFLIVAARPCAAAADRKKPYTVADEIGLSRLIPDMDGSNVRFSPNGRYFAVYSSRGRLDLNRPQDSLRFYRSRDARKFLARSDQLRSPSPIWVINRSTYKEGPIIHDWRWLPDSSGVAFLERMADGNQRLVVADLRRNALEPLTSVTETVQTFDIRDRNNYVYTAASKVAHAEITRRDKMIADLRRQLDRQSGEISQMKAAQDRLESNLREGDASRRELIQQRTELAQKLDSAQINSQALQGKLDTLDQQSVRDTDRAKASETKVNDLTRLLQQRETDLEQQDQLLAHDRDIRELMGARDLYIAEVYDVAGTGETKKPYGRVFYTRGKSLIFYAYDLDQQTELRRASAFQAWGRRGPDRQQSVNLGIFYEDNASRKRWILKCDDPKTLAQIDAVFVTVEPNGGSHKPSSKPLLFAYLKVNPNHP